MIRRLRVPLLLAALVAAQAIFLYEMRPEEPPRAIDAAAITEPPVAIRIADLSGPAVITSPLGDRNAARDEKLALGETLKTAQATRAVVSVEGSAEILVGPASALAFLAARGGRRGIDLFLSRGSAYFTLDFDSGTAEAERPDTGTVTVHSPNMSCAALEPERTEFLLTVEEDEAK